MLHTNSLLRKLPMKRSGQRTRWSKCTGHRCRPAAQPPPLRDARRARDREIHVCLEHLYDTRQRQSPLGDPYPSAVEGEGLKFRDQRGLAGVLRPLRWRSRESDSRICSAVLVECGRLSVHIPTPLPGPAACWRSPSSPRAGRGARGSTRTTPPQTFQANARLAHIRDTPRLQRRPDCRDLSRSSRTVAGAARLAQTSGIQSLAPN